MKRFTYLLLLGTLFLGACGTPVVEKERKAIAVDVYATKDSIDVSRYDLGKQYINDAVRLVAPPAPKDRVKIPQFITDQRKTTKGQTQTTPQKYVVLPENENIQNIVVVGSEQYNKLLSENKDLRQSEADAKAKLQEKIKNTDKVLREKDAELEKYRSQPGFFGRIWNFIKGFFKWGFWGFLGIGVLVGIACLIFPAIIPTVLSILMTIFRVIRSAGNYILSLIGKLFKKKTP